MMMVIHAAQGALAGEFTQSAFIAFTFSFVVHFLMDLIPHGDHETLVENYNAKTNIFKVYSFLISDVIATLIFCFALAFSQLEFNAKVVTWGIIGGVLPDLLVATYTLTKVNLLKRFNDFHFYIHGYFPEKKNKNISFVPGMIMQAVLFFVLIKAVF